MLTHTSKPLHIMYVQLSFASPTPERKFYLTGQEWLGFVFKTVSEANVWKQ